MVKRWWCWMHHHPARSYGTGLLLDSPFGRSQFGLMVRITEIRELAARKGLAIERSHLVGRIWLRDPKNGGVSTSPGPCATHASRGSHVPGEIPRQGTLAHLVRRPVERCFALRGWPPLDVPIGELQVVGDSRRDALLLLLGHGTAHAAHELEAFAQAHHNVEGELSCFRQHRSNVNETGTLINRRNGCIGQNASSLSPISRATKASSRHC